MKFRAAATEDIPAVAAIYDAIHTAEEAGLTSTGWQRGIYPTEQTAALAVDAGDLYVLEEDGIIVASGRINAIQMDAYAQVDWQRKIDDDRVCVLHTLAVNPAFFGRGYGRRFEAYYEALACTLGRPYLRIDTNARNARARKLYQSLGYREAGVIPCSFNGIPDVHLVCLEKRVTEVWQVAAFTCDDSGGNMAGVVTDAEGLTRQEKLAIAEKMGYSETVFFLPSQSADWKLEYFTPVEQVPLCGHATIAAFTSLHQRGLPANPQTTIETLAGILRISAESDGTVFMQQNCPEFGELLPAAELASCIDPAAFSQTLPIQIVSTGLRDILLPVRSPEALAALAPDFAAMTELSRKWNVVGVHAFALLDDGNTAVCRNFAPLYGIPEESATGTANCALACYLHHHGLRRSEYCFTQGHELHLPSQITVRLETEGEEICNVFVGGKGTIKGNVYL